MITNAGRWDHFLDYVRAVQVPWAEPAEDTDLYRKKRAVELFVLGARISQDLIELKPTMESWVPHITTFIVPRQVVPLGDPSRRSADACESLGSLYKKRIKHLTCRRRPRTDVQHTSRTSGRELWRQNFMRGYIQQVFARMNVSERLRHGEDNVAYLQRADVLRASRGTTTLVKFKSAEPTSPPRSIRSLMEADDP